MSYERFKEKRISSKEILETTPLNDELDKDFEGKTIVFTGTLKLYTRKEAKREVCKRGAKSVPDSLSKSTDMLIVADSKDNTDKDNKALYMNEQGAHIRIINESTFYKMLENNEIIQETEVNIKHKIIADPLENLINMPITYQGNLMFIDTEYTTDKDIYQISTIICNNGMVTETFNQYIKPFGEFKVRINPYNITSDKLKNCPTFKEFWEKAISKYKDYTYIGHNFFGADRHSLEKTMNLYNIPVPNFKFIDTMDLAKKFLHTKSKISKWECEIRGIEYPKKCSVSLSSLCQKFGFPILKKHDSSFDVKGCYDLFWYFYNTYKFNIEQEII